MDRGPDRPTGRTLWVERAVLLLIVACLGGTLNLVISIHRRALAERERKPSPGPVAETQVTADPPKPAPSPPPASPRIAEAPKPAEPPRPLPPPQDPTKKAVGELSAATAREVEAARQADEKARSLEKARLAAVAESDRWRRRELLVKQQVDSLTERARKIDGQIDTLAAQRDVLARERDALKAAVAKAQQGEGSYAVLPYKGPNGSWRRPIVLECSNGSVTLRPKGPTFSMLDLSAMINPRSSPVIVAIARELLRVQNSESPDGAPVVPYFVFLVRPDGIRPYYELRARLEPLGIAFGYELVEQDLKVDVPDFDNLTTWDGTIPLEEPLLSSNGSEAGGLGDRNDGDGLAWPGAGRGASQRGGAESGSFAGRPGRPEGGGSGDEAPDTPDAFVWPTQRTPRVATGGLPSELPRPNGTSGQGRRVGEHPGGGALHPSNRGNGGPGSGRGRGGLNLALEPASRRPGEPAGPGTGGGLADTLELQPAPGPGLGSGGSSKPGVGGLAGLGGGSGRPGGGSGVGSGDAGANGLGAGVPGLSPATGRTRAAGNTAGLPDLEPAGDRGASAPGLDALTSAGKPGSRGGSDASAGAGVGAGGPGDGNPSGEPGTGGSPEPRPGMTGAGQAGSMTAPELDAALLGPALRAAARSGSGGRASGGSAGTVGIGLGSMAGSGSPSGPNGGSGLVLGSDPASGAKSQKAGDGDGAGLPRVASRIPDGPTRTIDVPFEIVVVCQSAGLVIHPGGYLITRASLERNKKDGVLVRELLAVARQRAAADPSIRPQPRVRFLVEDGGSTMFWNARRQILFSGLAWPMSLQVAGAQGTRLLDEEVWR